MQEGAVFLAACPFSESEAENGELQERLGHYLDVVEMHLVREIEVRSDSFFEAQGQLEGLNGEIVEACGKVRGLKEGIRVLTGEIVGPARNVQELSTRISQIKTIFQANGYQIHLDPSTPKPQPFITSHWKSF